MKLLIQVFAGFVGLLMIVQCSGGRGLPRPGRGSYCKAHQNPLPLDLRKAEKISMGKVGKAEGGLRPGTYIYREMEAYFEHEFAQQDPESTVPSLLAQHVAHTPKGNGEWEFDGKCYRSSEDIEFSVSNVVATQIEVAAPTNKGDEGRIDVLALKSFSFGFNGVRLFYDGPEDVENDSATLEDVYRLENGEGYFYEKRNTKNSDAPYEVRYRYPTVVDVAGIKVQLYALVKYDYYPPGETVPDNKLLP